MLCAHEITLEAQSLQHAHIVLVHNATSSYFYFMPYDGSHKVAPIFS